MNHYVLIYTGGMGMEMAEDERNAVMADWGKWYAKLGTAIVDGGRPFSTSKRVGASGVSNGTHGEAATGYTVIAAESLDAAVEQTRDHPHLKHGGQVTVYETIDMGS